MRAHGTGALLGWATATDEKTGAAGRVEDTYLVRLTEPLPAGRAALGTLLVTAKA